MSLRIEKQFLEQTAKIHFTEHLNLRCHIKL